jgi:hypothetical protein
MPPQIPAFAGVQDQGPYLLTAAILVFTLGMVYMVYNWTDSVNQSEEIYSLTAQDKWVPGRLLTAAECVGLNRGRGCSFARCCPRRIAASETTLMGVLGPEIIYQIRTEFRRTHRKGPSSDETPLLDDLRARVDPPSRVRDKTGSLPGRVQDKISAVVAPFFYKHDTDNSRTVPVMRLNE